jgi:hypothetical protein
MRVGIAIVKTVSFRGIQQEFSNVYHYDLLGAQTGPWEALVDEIKASEVGMHSTDVTFKKASVWSAGGTTAQNAMLFQKVLAGLGNQTSNAYLDRERAILIRWPAGFDTRGKPVYLRKWYHSCGAFAATPFANGNLTNTLAFTTAERAAFASKASEMDEVGVTEAWQICSASGRRKTGPPEAHKYLEHHQLGDMWR